MRRSGFLASSVLAVAMAIGAPGEARADDAAVAEAQARFNEGLQLADAGKNDEARLKFTQAVAVLKAPAVLFNLARVEQLTGHEMEALNHYKQFMKAAETDPKVTDAMREKTRGYIAELAKKAGQIDIDAPPEARIAIDGKPIEERPTEPVHVAPGRHTVEATFQGRVRSVSVDCTAGNLTKAKIDFDSGTIDPPGAETEKGSPTKWIVAGSLGALGLVGVGVGVGMGLSSQSAKSDAEAMRRATPGLCAPPGGSACDAYDAKRGDAKDAATIATIGYVGGGVLLAGAIAAAALWPKSTERAERAGASRARVVPVMGSGTAGLSMIGTF